MIDRRKFLQSSGVALVPAMLSSLPGFATLKPSLTDPPVSSPIRFFGDGPLYEPTEYLHILQQVNAETPITKDRYGVGGAVEALEKKFAAITGKEKAIYLPSGTMANQLAIAALSGTNSKVFVQELSHVFRDEADAAQEVFQKRLVPLAAGKAHFTSAALKKVVDDLPTEEAFQTGLGAVSIENPVRRADGRMVPIEDIKEISRYCRSKKIKLHLDGARLYMASAWSGISIREYASYFDTVYISLYKYLGASGGAILCGDAALIDTLPHLVKVHGGSMYGSWLNAAMALHRLEGFEERLNEARKRSAEIFSALNKVPGISISALDAGTNIYRAAFGKTLDGLKIQAGLNTNYNIRIPRPAEDNQCMITVNETLLSQPANYVINAFKNSL